MKLLAIDPGPELSAALSYDTDTRLPVWWTKEDNEEILATVEIAPVDVLAVEFVASYGMPVGADVFETCFVAGRFFERWQTRWIQPLPAVRVYRRDVKLHLCDSQRANDANIRQALIDRYGPGKEKAIGRKASPGPLYGLTGDGWAALALAITAAETCLAKTTAPTDGAVAHTDRSTESRS